MTYDRTEDLLQRLLTAVEGRGGIGGTRGGGAGGNQPSNDDIQNLLSRSREAGRELNRLQAGFKITTKQQLAFRDAQADASSRLNEINSVLYAYRNNQISLSKEQKKALEAERARLANTEKSNEASARFVSGVQQVRQNLEQFGSQMIQGNGAVVQAIQSGASGFTIAGAGIQAAAQLQNTAVQSMANMATSAGAALMQFGLAGKIAGGAMVLMGQYMGLQSSLQTQAKIIQTQIITQGAEQILKAFQTMTSSGATYVGGLQQVQKALKGSDYTLQDFSAMVEANKETLAKANVGVGDAALMFGRVGAIFDKDGKKMRKELMNLGFGYQEQGALMAEVMADMRRQDPTAKLAANEVAQQTKQYAIHLATIADLTGKNARQLMEEGRKKTAQLAFQNFLQTFNDPKIASRVEQAVAGIADPVMRQNIMERLTFGNVINKTGAVMESVNPALEAMSIELAKAAQAGKGAEEFMAIQQKHSKAVNQGFLSQREFNLAAAAPGSKIEALGEASANARTYINQMGTAAETFAEKQRIAKETKPVGAGTELTDQLNDMVIKAKALEKALQDEVIKKLPMMGLIMDEYMAKIRSILNGEVPSAKDIMKKQIEMMKNFIVEMWNGLPAWAKIALGVAGVVTAFSILAGAAITTARLIGGLRNIGELFRTGQLPGTGGTVESGGKRQLPPRDSRGRFTKIPAPDSGAMGGPMDKFSQFIFNILRALGSGAGAMIRGVMQGIAAGISAFGNPKILLGAAILAGSIIVIGGAVAGATWIMGKALPTLVDGLLQVQKLDGAKLIQAGKGAAAVAAGMLAFTALGTPTVVANLFNSVVEGVGSLFGAKSPLQKMMEFAKAGPELAKGADGIKNFANAMKTLQDVDPSKISAVAESLREVQKGMEGKAFYEFWKGDAIDVEKINQLAEAMKKLGGGMSAEIKYTTTNNVKEGLWNGLKTFQGKLLVSIDSESIAQLRGGKPVTTLNSPPATGIKLTDATLQTAIQIDPVVNQLSKLLKVNQDQLKQDKDEMIELLERLLVYTQRGNELRQDQVETAIKSNRALMKAF